MKKVQTRNVYLATPGVPHARIKPIQTVILVSPIKSSMTPRIVLVLTVQLDVLTVRRRKITAPDVKWGISCSLLLCALCNVVLDITVS